MKIYLETLGCPKNEIDSEVMLQELLKNNYLYTQDPHEAETIIINTCSFIEDAAQESVDTILELALLKEKAVCKKLIVTGCLPQRYGPEIRGALPEVDVFLGTGAFHEIAKFINKDSSFYTPDVENYNFHEIELSGPRVNHNHTAYIKIAEGCNHHCTYCIIPRLRGRQKSRPVGQIVKEALGLAKSGVKELILIAQDTTAYGMDLKEKVNLSILLEELVTKLCDFDKEIRIRILYAYPDFLKNNFLKKIAANDMICSYLDIPIQHVSNSVLKKMGRKYRKNDLLELIERIRNLIPDISLRTTVLLGFPGETEEDFLELLEFVKEIKFDNLGAFAYSDADDIKSHHLKEHISEIEKEDRLHRIMTLQSEISYENQQKHIGKTYDVIIEGISQDDPPMWEARTFFQAPEIDGLTLFRGNDLQTGSLARVRITNAMHYDLIGELV